MLYCAKAPCWIVIHRPTCLIFFPMPLLLHAASIGCLWNMRHGYSLPFFASRIIFHHGSCISKWSGTLVLWHSTVIRQCFYILKSPTYSNVVLVFLPHKSFCHYFDDAVAVKDWFIQAHLSKKIVFKGSPFLAALSALYLREWVTHDHQFRVIDAGMHANLIR